MPRYDGGVMPTSRARSAVALLTFAMLASFAPLAHADSPLTHDAIEGGAIDAIEVVAHSGKSDTVTFTDLGRTRTPGKYTLRIQATGNGVRIPHCSGRGAVTIDGKVHVVPSSGPRILLLEGEGTHDVRIDIVVSGYERRIACGEPIRVGSTSRATHGLSLLRFTSPHKGPSAGEAVVYVPRGHDTRAAGPVLVGLHPWNGGPWTYAAYRELLEEADAKDVVLLMPSGLGNSLYTEDAEDEVMRAIDALAREIAVDSQRTSIWGASMGGQGATTIGFHRPDRFAFIASYFGDSKFDRSTYVRSLLPTEEAARKVNALDVVDNARHQSVWLIHGEDDRVSKIGQSEILFDAMRRRQFKVSFDRVPLMGHEGPLVVRFVRSVVERAANARAPIYPSRVSFRSMRAVDTAAYGVRIVRAGEREAFVDIEKRDDGIHVLPATTGIVEIVLRPGALGAHEGQRIVSPNGVRVRWDKS